MQQPRNGEGEVDDVQQASDTEAYPMLQLTGHPFVDIGLAAMAAYVGKDRIAKLDKADFDNVARYVEDNYVRPPLRGHLTMAFTSNAWFAQDAYNPDKPGLSPKQCEQRRRTRAHWASRHLRRWEPSAVRSDTVCVFTGLPAVGDELSNKLMPGRAGRAQIPLLQGDEAINFFTGGIPGLPVAPEALLALQFMPMACAKVGVGLLAVHSSTEHLTLAFARAFLTKNIKDVAACQVADEDKLPGAQRALKTLLIEQLLDIETGRRREERRSDQAASITAYNFTNGKEPKLAIYHLPLQITDFLYTVQTPTYKHVWERIVERAWQPVTGRKGKKGSPVAGSAPRTNYLFEDLFTLPQEASRFVRLYFLRVPQHSRIEGDPRSTYSTSREHDLIAWSLLELFLRKVMTMDDKYIEQIRILGDKLAQYTRHHGGKRFFRQFFTEQNTSNFLDLLSKTNIAYVRFTHGRETLFDLDDFLAVFMDGRELLRPEWRLARDLVLIRMVEQLKDWIVANPDTVPEEKAQAGSAESIAHV